jgi:Zn-finger nucleic acid-binding protein
MTFPEPPGDAVASCPACAARMELRAAGDATIDVCPTCRGLWLDWFDGDTLALAEMAMPLSRRASAPVPAKVLCPRCTHPLEERAHDSSGPIVWRCLECAGSFLPRATVEALLIWAASSAPEPLAGDAPPASLRDATVLARLRGALRALFGSEGAVVAR